MTDRLQIALDAGESVAPFALTEAHLPALVSAINALGYTIMMDDETGNVRLDTAALPHGDDAVFLYSFVRNYLVLMGILPSEACIRGCISRLHALKAGISLDAPMDRNFLRRNIFSACEHLF